MTPSCKWPIQSFLSFLRKTCVTSIAQRFLIPVSTVSARNAWHNDLPFVSQKNDQKFPGEYFQKNWEGVCGTLPGTLTLFQTRICDFPYPISYLIKNLIPHFRPEALEPGAWPERVTSCYGTYTVDGVNIKKEQERMISSNSLLKGNGLIAKWWRSN